MHTCDYAYLTEVLEIDKDMQALLQRIETGLGFEKHYLGAQPIFQCLKSLNDLVRLSKALRVDFPFTDYATLEHIPVIEVEFVHLAGREDYPGQLTLLDTPAKRSRATSPAKNAERATGASICGTGDYGLHAT